MTAEWHQLDVSIKRSKGPGLKKCVKSSCEKLKKWDTKTSIWLNLENKAMEAGSSSKLPFQYYTVTFSLSYDFLWHVSHKTFDNGWVVVIRVIVLSVVINASLTVCPGLVTLSWPLSFSLTHNFYLFLWGLYCNRTTMSQWVHGLNWLLRC